MRRILVAVALLATACGLPDHQNPFDPATPPALQARATLTGSVSLEALGAAAPVLAGVGVSVPGVGSVTTDATGTWSLPSVPPGTWSIQFHLDRYQDALLTGVVVRLDDGERTVTVPSQLLRLARGSVAGTVALSAGSITGFDVGTDFSGAVVTLDGVGVPVGAAISDAGGAYRFEGVPVSPTGASYTVTARRTWFTSQTASVLALANASATVPLMTLPVAAGALAGEAMITNLPGGRDGLPSAGIGISVTGVAFNGTAFSAVATSGTSGAWSTGALPPGSYDILASITGRDCGGYPRAAVGTGAPTPAGSVLCLDTIAPAGLVLGAPAVTPPQLAGYTAATSVVVPIAVQATDATSPSNLAGYQLARGPAPDWTGAATVPGTPAALTFSGLSTDARNVLWARPVDTAGNAGAAVSVELIQDSQDPVTPALTTARAVVDSTSATVTISGSEGDANFLRYESATGTVAATATCPSSSGATFTATTPSTAVSLATNQKTCFYARAVDRAGRLSGQGLIEVTSDLMAPTSPTIAPLYDPSLLTIHGEYADFFVTAPATDLPAGGGVAWKNVAWVEVDTGSGYRPLCPQAACRSTLGVYNPCGCGCDDARLVCDGATFKAVRVPLLDGTSSSVGIRAVDLAGNVGSGASQLVSTATSLLPVDVGAESATHPRGRGRLLGYRFTDVFLRLRDLGDDGRPDATDNACNIGFLGSVVPRVAVLGARAVVHGDGNQLVRVRRPGVDGLFCSPANDDTEFTISTAPGTVTVRNVTGSMNSTRRGEYAAWSERTTATSTDAVKVQGPTAAGALATGLPAPATLYVLAAGTSVQDLLMGGDCLLSTLSPRSFQVDCLAGGLGSATGVTTWTLPSAAIAASLSADGRLLGWLERDLATGQPRLHVRSPGRDRVYSDAPGSDDSDVSRLVPGASPASAELTVEPGHLVVSETGVSSGSYWLLHWAAGPDGAFDAAAGADDTVARVLPSSIPRSSPPERSVGLVAYGVFGDGANLADVLAVDLSSYRWEAIESAGLDGLASNGAGTLFFHRGSNLTARLPNGTEQQGGFYASSFAAAGANLVTLEGSSVNLRRRSGITWFGPPTPVYTGTPWKVAAGDGWALVLTGEAGSRYRTANLSAATPTTTLLPVITGTTPGNNGLGISSAMVAYQCYFSGWNACVHHPGADGLFGTADDVTLVLYQPGTTTPYGAYGLAVSGDKIAFRDGAGSFIVVATGPDGLFNTADDVHENLGPAASGSAGNLTVAGDFAAWLQIAGSSGLQVMVADLAKGAQRQVTRHSSMKESLALDPSGRLTWIDFGFSAPAIFVSAP
jgi:hypothetical protein